MCSVAGVFDFGGRWPAAKLRAHTERMLAATKSRGPDSTGLREFSRGAIGMNRLAIVDVSSVQHVFADEKEQIAYVVNGEIFNHLELRAALEKRGHRFRTHVDSEVVGGLYLEHGPGFVNQLNGQFAIALYDFRAGKAFLYRDRFGICPLFYHFAEGRLHFASETRGLLACPEIDRTFNPRALDQLFTFWTTIGATTFTKSLLQVRPGHYVEFGANGARETLYYELDLARAKVDSSLTLPEASSLVRDSVTDAVKLRMATSDLEVGCYLSGGVDSSIVAAIAKAAAKGRPLKTFSLDFRERAFSEGVFQNELAAHLGSAQVRREITGADIQAKFTQAIAAAGQPLFRSAPVPMYHLAEAVREAGLKSVLTGEGADEIFWGYDTFKELAIRRFWARAPLSEARPRLFARLFPHHFSPENLAFTTAFYRRSLESRDSDFYSHLPRWLNNAALKGLYSKKLKEALAGYDPLEELRAQLPPGFSDFSPQSKCQYLEMVTLLPNYLLSSQGDRMAGAHGVELRPVFLDHRLVELCHRIPGKYKLGPKLTDKHVLREAFRDVLPENIYRRSKQAYQSPGISAFREGFAVSRLGDLLSLEATERFGVFDPAKVEMLRGKISLDATPGTRDNLAFMQVLSTHVYLDQLGRGGGA